MEKGRRWELDKCRVFASLMVVLLHVLAQGYYTPGPTTFEWRVFNLADTMVRGSVPLFFMISGALFFSREKLDLGVFIKKNVGHLLFIYIAWSLLYDIFTCLIQSSFEWGTFFVNFCKGHYHLWFLPAMILCYLLLPVIHHALKGYVLHLGYLIFLFGVCTLFVVNVKLIPSIPKGISILLGKWNLSNMQYIGYMVWGYFLAQKKFGKRTRMVTIPIYLVAGFVTAAANRWYSIGQGKAVPWLYGYFTIPSFIQATVIFCFFLTFAKGLGELGENRAEEAHPQLWHELSSCTLGIYLIHPMVLETLLHVFNLGVKTGNPIYRIPLVFGIVISLCFITIFLLRRIPFIRKLV